MNYADLAKKCEKVFREHRDEYNRKIQFWLSPTGISNVVVGYESGRVKALRNQACHAGLHLTRDKKGTPKLILSGIQCYDSHPDERICVNFYDWLLNRSMWAEIFYSKDAEEAYKQGFVLAKASVPANLMVSGLITTRCLWEKPYIAKSWDHLVKHGMDESLAFVFGAGLSIKENRNLTIQNSSGHFSFDSLGVSKEETKEFVKGKTPHPDVLSSNYKKMKDYDRVNTIICSTPMSDNGFVKHCHNKTCKRIQGAEGKCRNPFSGAVRNKKEVPFKELKTLISVVEEELNK